MQDAKADWFVNPAMWIHNMVYGRLHEPPKGFKHVPRLRILWYLQKFNVFETTPPLCGTCGRYWNPICERRDTVHLTYEFKATRSLPPGQEEPCIECICYRASTIIVYWRQADCLIGLCATGPTA